MSGLDSTDSPGSTQALTRSRPIDYKRLTKDDIALILNMAALGKTQTETASLVGCSLSTVSDTLAKFMDSRELARKRLEGGALKLAQTVVNTKDSTVALKALGKLDVVREDQAGAGNNVVVVMGQADRPLDPPVIEIQTFAISPSLSPDHE